MKKQLDLKKYLEEYAIDTGDGQHNNLLLDTLMESNYYDLEKLINHIKVHRNKNRLSLNILHLNIQSLPSKFERFKDLIAQLEDQDIVLDAILLCETFLHDSNVDLYKLSGYNLIFRNRSRIKGGGVAIYLRDNFNYSIRNDISTFIEGEFESLFIETTLLNKNTIIGEIYRTPGSNAKSSLEHFENIISKLKGNRQVLIGTTQIMIY